MKLKTTAKADWMILELDAWWRVHRASAASLRALLQPAFEQLLAAPLVGKVYPHRRVPGARKLLVRGTPYAIYYRADLEREEITVLAVWSAMRRRGPPLG